MSANQDKLTQDVVDAFGGTPDARLRELMTSLVKHCTPRERGRSDAWEWLAGLKFLNATGQISTDKRPELSAVRHAGAVDDGRRAPAARAAGGAMAATEAPSAVLPVRRIYPWAPTLPRVCSASRPSGPLPTSTGKLLAGALLDVVGRRRRQVRRAVAAEPMRGRGRCALMRGRYWFWSIRPMYYPVPVDGPVGDMLRATNRNINRPGHIHMMVSADGHVPVTTHVFVARSPYIDEDVVFGKRDSLVVEFDQHAPGKAPDGRVMTTPYHSASYDFRLAPKPV
jgi:hydroxyquinol 1,2-dioxygenase